MKLTPLNITHCLVYCTMSGRTNWPVPSLCPKTHKLLGGSPWEEQEVGYNPSYKLSCSIADWLCPKTNLKIDFSNLRAFGPGYRRDILLGRGAQGPVQLGISILMASARAVRAPAVVNIHGISLFPCCARCSHCGASSGPEHMGLRIQHVFFRIGGPAAPGFQLV